MPETGYLLAVIAIGFGITFALRALPFVILQPLRDSRLVTAMALWMPAGILAILAVSTLRSSIDADTSRLLPAAIATGVTIAAHLLGGRRTLLSGGLGTVTFVAPGPDATPARRRGPGPAAGGDRAENGTRGIALASVLLVVLTGTRGLSGVLSGAELVDRRAASTVGVTAHR